MMTYIFILWWNSASRISDDMSNNSEDNDDQYDNEEKVRLEWTILYSQKGVDSADFNGFFTSFRPQKE